MGAMNSCFSSMQIDLLDRLSLVKTCYEYDYGSLLTSQWRTVPKYLSNQTNASFW